MKPDQITGLQAFARYMVDASLDGGDVDGGTIQEMACQYGLLTKKVMAGPCCELEEGYCACTFESGFPVECYRVTDVLIAQSAPAEVAQGEDSFGADLPIAWACKGSDFMFGTAHEASRYLGEDSVVTPLYTAPPSPDAELVELKAILPALDDALESLEMHGRHSDQGYRELKDWYRKIAGITARIDAKLASLEVKP